MSAEEETAPVEVSPPQSVLCPELLRRVEILFQVFTEVSTHPLSYWVDLFQRSQDPRVTIGEHEAFAAVFQDICAKVPLSYPERVGLMSALDLIYQHEDDKDVRTYLPKRKGIPTVSKLKIAFIHAWWGSRRPTTPAKE